MNQVRRHTKGIKMEPVIARCTGSSSITNTTQLTKIKNMFIIMSELTN